MDDIQNGVTKQYKQLYSVTVKAAKLTSEALADILKGALENGMEGLKEYSEHDFNSLENNGSLENIEVSQDNIGDFAEIANKYDVECFIRKDKLAESPTYRVYFKTSDTEQFQKAFTEYLDVKSGKVQPKAQKKYHLPEGYRKRVVKNIGKYYSDPAQREQRNRDLEQDKGISR